MSSSVANGAAAGPSDCAAGEAQKKSEFLTIFIPSDESGLGIVVEEFDTAEASQQALIDGQAKGWWRDIIMLYRHPGKGPLSNKWWGGGSTIYERRYWRDVGAEQ